MFKLILELQKKKIVPIDKTIVKDSFIIKYENIIFIK